VVSTNLVLCALEVRGADGGIGPDWGASYALVRPPGVAIEATTKANTILGDAFCPNWTGHDLAHVNTCLLSSNLFLACLVGWTLTVRRATTCWLTGTGKLVLGQSLLANTDRPPFVDLTTLVVRARHDLTRV
jgi:hypothetical protein